MQTSLSRTLENVTLTLKFIYKGLWHQADGSKYLTQNSRCVPHFKLFHKMMSVQGTYYVARQQHG